MSLKSTIESDMKEAMRAKDKDRLRALRAIKSMIMLEVTKEGSADELSEEDEIKLLSKAAKQRRDSIEIYQKQERTDLAEVEIQELTVIEAYLPKQLSEEELKTKIEGFIKEVGASSARDMGKVMGLANKELAGKADGKVIASIVKSLLN
jgi:hypothetical protein